jgi:hypothetical protein
MSVHDFGPENLDVIQCGVSIGIKVTNQVFEKVLQEFDDFLDI